MEKPAIPINRDSEREAHEHRHTDDALISAEMHSSPIETTSLEAIELTNKKVDAQQTQDHSPFKETVEIASMRRPKSNFYELPGRPEIIVKAIQERRYKLFSDTAASIDHKKAARVISENKIAFNDLEKRGVRVAKTSFIIGRPPGSNNTTPPTLLSVVEKIEGENLQSRTSFTKDEISRVDHTFASCLDHILDGWNNSKPIFIDIGPRQFLYTNDGPILTDTDPVVIKRMEGDSDREQEYKERLLWICIDDFIKSADRIERNTRSKLTSYHDALQQMLLTIQPPRHWQAKASYNSALHEKIDPELRHLHTLNIKYPFLGKLPLVRNLLAKLMQINEYLS